MKFLRQINLSVLGEFLMSSLIIGIIVAIFSFLGTFSHYEYQSYRAKHKKVEPMDSTVTTSYQGGKIL